jgi:putative addiction module killer protein
MIQKFELIVYCDESGFEPYTYWVSRLGWQIQNIINKRLLRLRVGNFGDCKAVGDGIFELRIHVGAGYRIYFTKRNQSLILLLCGGDKSTQKKDVIKAKKFQNKITNS